MCHQLYQSKTLHFTYNVYAFCVILAIKSDYFPKQQEMVCHCNWDVVHLLSGMSWYILRRHTADLTGITALSSLMCISQQNHTDKLCHLYSSPLSEEWMGPSARFSPPHMAGGGTIDSPRPASRSPEVMLFCTAPAEKSGIIPTDESNPPAKTAAEWPRKMLSTRLLNCTQNIQVTDLC